MAACPSRVIGARRAPSAAPAPARARARAAARRQRRAVPRAAKRQNAPYEGGASRGAHAPADNGLACARRAPMASVPPHRNECAPRPPHWALRRRRTRACAVATGRSRRAALLHAFYSSPPPRSVEERHPMGSFWRMHPAPPRRERTRAPQTRGAPKTPRKSQRVCLGASPPPTRALFGCARQGGATGCVIWGLYPPPRPTETETPRAAVRRPPLAQDVPWWRLFSPRLTEPARRPCRRARAGLGTGKPPWLRQRAPQGDRYEFLSDSLRDLKLNTVCEEAKCPNVGGTPLAQRAAQETKRPRPPRRGWGGWWLKEPPAPHSNVKRTPRPLLGARC